MEVESFCYHDIAGFVFEFSRIIQKTHRYHRPYRNLSTPVVEESQKLEKDLE